MALLEAAFDALATLFGYRRADKKELREAYVAWLSSHLAVSDSIVEVAKLARTEPRAVAEHEHLVNRLDAAGADLRTLIGHLYRALSIERNKKRRRQLLTYTTNAELVARLVGVIASHHLQHVRQDAWLITARATLEETISGAKDMQARTEKMLISVTSIDHPEAVMARGEIETAKVEQAELLERAILLKRDLKDPLAACRAQLNTDAQEAYEEAVRLRDMGITMGAVITENL